jgi:glycosyltransferase involved in cell wall biosynthesis
LKVLVVSSKYLPEYSGSGLRAHNTYQRLHDQFGIEREVICSSTGTTTSENYEIDGVEIERIVSGKLRKLNRGLSSTPFKRISNLAMFHTEARTVRNALENRSFDVIHTLGYSPATTAAIKWSRDNGVPLLEELVNSGSLPYQYLPGTRRFSTYDLATQSVVVAISENIAATCRRFGLTENVWTRPNPVDSHRFSPATADEISAARIKISPAAGETDVLIVYVAKFLKRKNHSFLIDVIAALPDNYNLVLAGPPLMDTDLVAGWREDQFGQLTDKARSLGVENRVVITPGFADMREHLAAADVFCFPAEKEGMGTPLLESISMGVPVVANADESSFQEWVVEGENGYLRPLRTDQWAEAIIQAASLSTQQKSTMAENIKDRTSSDTIDDQYLKLLNALADSSPTDTVNVAEILSR